MSQQQRKHLWLCIHLPWLPLEVFTRSMSPGEADTPVVIHVRQRVAFLNQAAMEAGIQIGSSMDTAYTLSARVISVARDESKEARALRQLADWSYQFSPVISIKTENSLLLEIGGCLKLFQGLGNLKRCVQQGLDQLGYQCQLAHSPTPLGALLVAKATLKGDSLKGADALSKAPVSCMEAHEKIIQSLHSMGIKNMAQLLALPMSGLGKRFGKEFMDYLYRLTGTREDPQINISPAPTFFSEVHFLTDVTNMQSLLFPMKRLLSEFSSFLTSRQLAIDKFTWRFNHRNHEPMKMLLYIASPENNQQMFLALTQLQLEQFKGLAEVDNLALIATEFSPAQLQTDDLFRGNSFGLIDEPTTKSELFKEGNLLLNTFRARLGPQTCFGLSMANDHRPEKAWKLIRFNQKDYWHPKHGEINTPRPTYLLSTPERLYDKPASLHRESGNPASSRPPKIELLQGPERIDYGWWDQDSPRDYFVARHHSGTLYWIFNQLDNGAWYLHGIFG
jgi:protein ImuB